MVNGGTFASKAETLTTAAKFKLGWKAGASGFLLGLPFEAIEVAQAKKGEVAPMVMSKGLALGAYPLVTAAAFMALTIICPWSLAVSLPFVEGGLAEAGALVIGGIASSMIETSSFKGIRYLSQTGRRVNHIEMGGNYKDTESAYNLRMRSISEMGACMQPSRRYLGQEGLLLHQQG